MTDKPDGGPVFPKGNYREYIGIMGDHEKRGEISGGLTKREYAAIKLRVADSGLPWLDEMIEKSRRDESAGMALQGIVANPARAVEANVARDAKAAYLFADAMLEEREK